jgi:hypothetical protein
LKYNDSYAGAAAGGEILMGGYSDSQSVRFIDFDGNYVTEGLGTYVRAGSNVESYGYQYDYDRGLGYADADLSGGYIVAGGAAARTIQTTNTGMATAQATGAYVGKGELNCNFRGSVEGQTFTTVTRAAGMNGTISHSEAAMSVTAISTPNMPN